MAPQGLDRPGRHRQGVRRRLRDRGAAGPSRGQRIVNAGGDLRCFGRAEPIHVRRPDAPATLVPLGWLHDLAIATSGGYFAGIERDGRQIDPLVDPGRRACAVWEDSISVVAADCMTADALTKVVRLARQRAPEILDRCHAQAVVVGAQAIGMCGAPLLRRADAP